MTALLSPTAETCAMWALVICAGIWLAADRSVAVLCWWDRRNETDDWLEVYGPRVAYGSEELPIFGDALAEHVAKHAALSIDDELEALLDGRWGRG